MRCILVSIALAVVVWILPACAPVARGTRSSLFPSGPTRRQAESPGFQLALADGSTLRGELLAVRDSIVIVRVSADSVSVVPAGEIVFPSQARGGVRHWMRKHGVAGILVGAPVGAMLGILAQGIDAAFQEGACVFDCARERHYPYATAALVGAGVGGLFGFLIETRPWSRHPPHEDPPRSLEDLRARAPLRSAREGAAPAPRGPTPRSG